MIGWVHIVLIGASVIANAQRSGLIGYSIPELEVGLKRDASLRAELSGILLEFVKRNPRAASAELNTCIELIVKGYEAGRQQWCYLFSSDTEIGKLCGYVLASYLKEFSREKLDSKLSVKEPVSVQFLGTPDRFNDGLANLFEMIVRTILYHKKLGDRVFVHATGGFKPETAIAILAANMPTSGAPTFYVHEYFNQIVRIPAMPIAFRRWKRFSEVMNHLTRFEMVSREGLERTYGRRAVEEAIKLGWIEEESKHLRLSAFGRLLWDKWERLTR